MTYKLYGINASPFVRKVRAYLNEKGIAYDHEPVNPFSPPDNYKDISPLGKIPALSDGENTLADSTVICIYLERKNPTPPLYPSDDYDYARALWFEEYIDAAVVPKAGPNVFMPLVIEPVMNKQEVTDETRAEVKTFIDTEIAPMWDYLEGEIAGRDFFAGDSVSIGDLAVASIHMNLYHAGVDIDPNRWPALAGFIERMFARPSFASLLEEETPMWSQRA